MAEVLLWTFQPAARATELRATGRLVGAWEYVTVADAHMLVGDPLRDGYVTIEFSAPAELVLTSDYGAWNDHLRDLAAGVGAVARWDVPTPIADEQVQVCLPFLRAEWVREVRPLPRSPDDVADWEARA